MAKLTQAKDNDLYYGFCAECATRGRRGATVTFPPSRSADAQEWLARHRKHN